jgi:hypothetical protein
VSWETGLLPTRPQPLLRWAHGRQKYLIGAQKADTTDLSTLRPEPEVCVSDPKEQQFFTTVFKNRFGA